MNQLVHGLRCRLGRILRRQHDVSRIRQSVLQLEQLEDRYLLAGDPFTVLSTEFVQTTGTQSLVQFGEVWKYLDNGSNQGTAWSGLSFNDTSWNAGPAQLGYGDGDEATVVSYGDRGGNKYVTTYFRHELNIADASLVKTLGLALIRDDGAAVYLNGVELLRDGLTAGAAYNSLATQTIGGNAENTPVLASIDIGQLPPGTLRSGANVLAVEVHQSAVNSSDISFDLSVNATYTGVNLIADFNAAVNPSTLQASDLVIDGTLTATSVALLDADTVAFGLPLLATGSSHTASIAQGVIANVQQTGINPYSRIFTIAGNSQYAMKYTPYIQLGDAPLTGFAGSQTDQIELLWQTVPGGSGTQDQFVVDYRLANSGSWSTVSNISHVDVGADQRVNHSAVIAGLSYDTLYEYRLRHLSGGVTLASYENTFRTRLPAGDSSEFSFVAYGDSANLANNTGFRQVQSRINEIGFDFALLLGDNAYENGDIGEFDARFDPLLNPEATAWTSNHIDYLSIGNHDVVAASGTPSELNYAVPIPIAGVNAPAAPPSTERPEHHYSFDYGDVHFVTFDSNSLNNSNRLNRQLQYVEADLAASSARWKIVFTHRPVAEVPNGFTQTENYYDQVVPRLHAAGVDLLLTGHEHTYSWTYPLLDQAGGQPTFVADTDKSYAKGDGLIQVIAGTGGKSLGPGVYNSFPFVASGFTTATTPKAKDGFAKLDVSPNQLTVSYIAADNGAIIDSFTITAGFSDANEVVSVDEDSSVSSPNLLNGTTSPNGPVSVTGFTLAGNATLYNAGQTATIAGVGTLRINANGAYNFTPVANYNGPVPIATYTVSDGSSTDTSTLTIAVLPVDDAFVDADESVTTLENTPISGSVLTGTSSVDGPVTVTSFTLAGSATVYAAGSTATITGVGTLQIKVNGDYTFTPATNYNGPVPVATYTLTDGSGTGDTSTLTISVTPDNPNALQTVTFQQGVSGYTSTRDTYLRGAYPNTDRSKFPTLNVDGLDSGQQVHTLLRFDDIFGSGAGQIPLNANIQSAILVLNVTDNGHAMQLYRMLQPWSDTAGWNSFAAGGGGIQAGVEAASSADAVTASVPKGLLSINITASLRQWLTNPANNFGWALLPTGNNGVDFDSAEGKTPPRLVIEFQNSSSARFTGTAANDTFVFDASGANYSVKVNGGAPYILDASVIKKVSFDGLAGNDRVTYIGGAANETATLRKGSLTVTKTGFKLNAFSVEAIVVNAGTGTDRANFYDSSGNDTFYGRPTYSYLTGTDFFNIAKSFDKVYAKAMAGGDNDRAFLYDSAGNDTFYGRPAYSYLTGTDFFNFAKSFDKVYAKAMAGGDNDRAFLYDSAGNDLFYGQNDYGVLSGLGFYNHVCGFDSIKAVGNVGGFDTLEINGILACVFKRKGWEIISDQ